MRLIALLLLFAAGASGQTLLSTSATSPELSNATVMTLPGGEVEVLFSPRGGIMDRIIAQIDGAQKSVHMQAYSFTSLKIESALERAAARGVDVQVILDKSYQTTAPRVESLLRAAGIPLKIDGKHPIAHNKVIIIDGERVLTGSYNFTAQAEIYNAENSVLIRNSTIAAQYEAEFQKHSAHSQ